MRENFICTHFAISQHCKIGSKAHFFAAPPPHLFRSKISVFPTFPRFEPDFGRFFESTHSFFALRSPLFSCSFPFWVRLRTIFRGIFRVSPSALPFLHSVKAFSFRASLILHSLLHPHRPIYFPSALHSPLPLHLPPPISFSFLPTFPSPSPINERTCAPSRNTRVRVRPHLPARQEVFIYCLHRFTHPSQPTGHQHIRCEEKQEKAFTKHTTIS